MLNKIKSLYRKFSSEEVRSIELREPLPAYLTYISETVLPDSMRFDELPDDILIEIFVRCDPKSLCNSLNTVSRRWHDLIESQTFWIQKGLKDKKLNGELINLLSGAQLDAKEFYFCDLFSRNLLKNPCAEMGFKHWINARGSGIDTFNSKRRIEPIDVKSTIGDLKDKKPAQVDMMSGWDIENEQNYVGEPLLDEQNQMFKCFVTSYSMGEKLQIIDLYEHEKNRIIRQIDAPIKVSEFYVARKDCGSIYKLGVFLISEDYEIIDKFFYEDQMPQWSDGEWKQASHTFKSCKNVKYIIVYHAGVDTQFWAGNYGSKMTNGSAQILLNHN